MSTQARLTRKLGLGSCLKNVVPVVVRGPEALDGRMESDHGAGHVLAGGIGVKATINEIALGDQGVPASAGWVERRLSRCSGAGGREPSN